MPHIHRVYTWDEACEGSPWIKCHDVMSVYSVEMSLSCLGKWLEGHWAWILFRLLGMPREIFLPCTFARTGLWNKTISTWWYFTDCFGSVYQDEWYFLLGDCVLLGLDIKIEIFVSHIFVCCETQGSVRSLWIDMTSRTGTIVVLSMHRRVYDSEWCINAYVFWHAKMTFNDLLVISIRPKAKYSFCFPATFFILQK